MSYPPPPPSWQPSIAPPIASSVHSQRPKGSPVGWLIAGGVLLLVAIVGIVLGLDELRAWRAKERTKEELRIASDKVSASQLAWAEELIETLAKQERELRKLGDNDAADFKQFAIDGFSKQLARIKAGTDKTPQARKMQKDFEAELARRGSEVEERQRWQRETAQASRLQQEREENEKVQAILKANQDRVDELYRQFRSRESGK
jgi:hypothetical protein